MTGTSLVNVSNLDVKEWSEEPGNVYIGRAHEGVPASKWANTFKVGEHGRENALKLYKDKLLATPSLMEDIGHLAGSRLGCFCWPDEECHGQILINILSVTT